MQETRDATMDKGTPKVMERDAQGQEQSTKHKNKLKMEARYYKTLRRKHRQNTPSH